MTTTMRRTLRTYCHDDPGCIGEFVHSGPHRPGCRICRSTDHVTPTCPSWGEPYVYATEEPAMSAPFDPSKPYVFRIERTDVEQPASFRMLSFGGYECAPVPTEGADPAELCALFEIARARVGHGYDGPLVAYVWQRRGGEHYRDAPPADAYTLTMAGNTPGGDGLQEWERDLVQADRDGRVREATDGPVIPPVVLSYAPPRRALSPLRHHDECESPDGGSCTCDLIAEYGAPSDRDN